EKLEVAGGQTRDRERFLHDVGVAVDARGEVADLALTVVVDRRALDHREDRVAIMERVRETPKRDDSRAVRQNRSCGELVERAAVPIGREDLALVVEVAGAMRYLDGRTAGQRDVAL